MPGISALVSNNQPWSFFCFHPVCVSDLWHVQHVQFPRTVRFVHVTLAQFPSTVRFLHVTLAQFPSTVIFVTHTTGTISKYCEICNMYNWHMGSPVFGPYLKQGIQTDYPWYRGRSAIPAYLRPGIFYLLNTPSNLFRSHAGFFLVSCQTYYELSFR